MWDFQTVTRFANVSPLPCIVAWALRWRLVAETIQLTNFERLHILLSLKSTLIRQLVCILVWTEFLREKISDIYIDLGCVVFVPLWFPAQSKLHDDFQQLDNGVNNRIVIAICETSNTNVSVFFFCQPHRGAHHKQNKQREIWMESIDRVLRSIVPTTPFPIITSPRPDIK